MTWKKNFLSARWVRSVLRFLQRKIQTNGDDFLGRDSVSQPSNHLSFSSDGRQPSLETRQSGGRRKKTPDKNSSQRKLLADAPPVAYAIHPILGHLNGNL